MFQFSNLIDGLLMHRQLFTTWEAASVRYKDVNRDVQPYSHDGSPGSPRSTLQQQLSASSCSSPSSTSSGDGSSDVCCGAAPCASPSNTGLYLPEGPCRYDKSSAQCQPFERTVLKNSCTVVRCPLGVRVPPEALPPPRANTWWEEVICLTTMLALFGFMALLPWLLLLCLYGCSTGSPVATALFVAALASAVLPLGKVSPAFQRWALWDTWRRHYQMRAVTPPLPFLDPARRYLCVQFPHAVFPMACFLNVAVVSEPDSGFPAGMAGVVASILLRVPLYRHLFAWIGCHPADRAVLLRLLAERSVGMVPEGVAGIFQGASPAREAVFLRQRKGFVRVALQAGADIVPVYHLGNSQMLSLVGSRWASRKLRTAVGAWWGRWGLPLPRRHPLIMLVGSPIPVGQCDEPSDQVVDALHARVMADLIALFDQHKHLMPGWEAKTLKIV